MEKFNTERRKYPRYDTDLEVFFQVKYDIKTRVEYRVLEGGQKDGVPGRYSGLCRNVSAEGLSFTSKRQLQRGDILFLEVYEPSVKNPVGMEGRVCWSEMAEGEDQEKGLFRTGLQIISVNGRSVADSVYFDKKYRVMWSDLLESLFGTFAALKK